jgi:redox-sensitive bicupin YhaK (pirin superfamily)
MEFTLRKADTRGTQNHGWLQSRHTFSFGDYHDPAHMGFRSLRVINEDQVAPGGGFPTHPHRDMEIFSYVLEGSLQHRDSMGNGRVLAPGEIQLMSAGSGVTHSEFNPSAKEVLHFLQIWINPRQRGLEPRYTEWRPRADQNQEGKILVISRDGRDGSARIQQDAEVYRVRLEPGHGIRHEVGEGRGVWFQLVGGSVRIGGHTLSGFDAVGSEDAGLLSVEALDASEGLLFDLP